jgi:hypothetical protein
MPRPRPPEPEEPYDPSWETTDTWSEEQGWGDEVEPSPDLAPALATHQIPARRPRRPPVSTRALLRQARNPWLSARLVLSVAAIIGALGTAVASAGEPSQTYMTLQAGSGSKASLAVAQAVRAIPALLHPEQFDSRAQFNLYGGAACAPTALAMVLTAWDEPHATIGQMIDELGPYISPTGGLLDDQGFVVVAAKHHMRADISWTRSYNQMLYMANVLGLPVIIDVRQNWGYFHYFAGGHFLVVTGGDAQGVSIADSSLYFIKYLPRDVLDQMWQWKNNGTAETILLVPQDFQYTLPPS